MSTRFIALSDGFLVSPQISLEDVKVAADQGVTLIINNRPDGEEPAQLRGADVEAAAIAAGLAYVSIPVGAMGFNEKMIDAFDEAVANSGGTILAYCRSGTRSTVLRAVSEARKGRSIMDIIEEAGEAGYDIAGQAGLLKSVQAG